MADEQRFQTGFIEAESDLPGLVQELDGTVWLVNPNGSRTKLPGGGGSGGLVFQQDTDPGAVGAGNFWLNTSLAVGQPSDSLPMYVRNSGDTGWIAQGLAYYVDGDVRSFVTVGDGGVVAELLDVDLAPVAGLVLTTGGVFFRWGSTYLHFQESQCYFNLDSGQPFWIQGPGGPTWGVSDPSGAEKFYAIDPPADGEVAIATRLHWYDDTMDAPALRFKQKDTSGTLSVGKSVGITDDGVLKLENLPTADPIVGDQIWAADGVLTLSGFTPGGGFTGWTEDASDPANVSTNGGGLNLGTGLISDTAAIYTFGFSGLLGDNFTNFIDAEVGGITVGSDAGAENAEVYSMRVGHGVQSNPAAGQAAYKALGLAGGTVALDAGGLLITDAGAAEAAGSVPQLSQVSPLFTITSGALPTQQFVSGAAAQVSTARDVEVHTPVTMNSLIATSATCKVELSPDGVTFSTLCVWTEPVGVAFAGSIIDVVVRVPAGWQLKLTTTQAVLGLSTYY